MRPPAGMTDVIRNPWSDPTDPETRMTIAEMVYRQVKLLPDPLTREVLDFVGFLREGRDRAGMARPDERAGDRAGRRLGQSGG